MWFHWCARQRQISASSIQKYFLYLFYFKIHKMRKIPHLNFDFPWLQHYYVRNYISSSYCNAIFHKKEYLNRTRPLNARLLLVEFRHSLQMCWEDLRETKVNTDTTITSAHHQNDKTETGKQVFLTIQPKYSTPLCWNTPRLFFLGTKYGGFEVIVFNNIKFMPYNHNF